MTRENSIKSFCIYILITFSVFLNAQNYLSQVQQYSVEQGLSHREVHDMFQDSRGLFWIATRYGLNRFDGHHFTWFTKEKQGLSSNHINKVLEDPQGWLWILSAKEGSDFVYDFVDLMNVTTLELMPWSEKGAPFSPSDIEDCIVNKKGELFITIKSGKCWKLNTEGDFIDFMPKGLKNFHPKFFTSKNTLWGVERLSDTVNLLEIDSLGKVLQKIKYAADNLINFAGEDAKGRVWYRVLEKKIPRIFFIEPNQQARLYDLTNTPLGDISAHFNYPKHQLFIHPQNFSFWWTGESLFGVATSDGQQVELLHEKDQGLTIVTNVFFDKEGKGWVTTIDGIFKIEFEPSKFKNLLSLPYKDVYFASRIECRGIVEGNKGEVFVNSYAGTFHIGQNGQTLAENALNVNEEQKWASMALYNAPSGDIWFGWHSPIKRDGQTGEFTFYHLPDELEAINIWSIYQQASGRMWFGGLVGHFAFLEPGRDTIQFFNNYEGFEELKNANILNILPRSDGKCWLGTNAGLYLFDPVDQKILERYWSGGQAPYYLPHDNIHHLCQDGDSLLWLATGGGGLIQLEISSNPSGRSFSQFQKSDGLSTNVLYAVYPDDFGNLWISSDYGIIQFNKATKLSRTFLHTDGLPHYEFNRISHHQATDGQLYFGSLNGVTTFHPRDFQNFESRNDAPLVLLGLEQFEGEENRLVNKLPEFAKRPEIVLHPGDRVVNLEFALLDYHDPKRIRYAYKVEGADEEWTHLRENHISLSGLPYGDFILKIKGQASTGVFSNQELNIPLIVLKPFYLQTWFLILIGAFFIIAFPTFYKIRTARLQQQKRELEAEVKNRTQTIQQQNKQLEQQAQELRHLDEVKSRFFANVSHELRTPLTLLLGPIGSVLKSNQLNNRNFTLLKKAQTSGKNLLQLISEILDLSKMESGRMLLDEKPVQLNPLLRRIFSQFESHARLQGLKFIFEYQAANDLQILLDTDKFEKTVNNFLSNAIKFTSKGGKVTLYLKEFDSYVLLSVADTGQGIHPDDVPHVFDRFYQTSRPDAPAEGGTGIGLALVNEFAQLFEGKTWVESTLGQGSTFFFEFPKKLIASGVWDTPSVEDLEVEEFSPLPAAINPENGTPHRAKVLVVEDNPSLRDYLRLILEERYEVTAVENGQAAWEWLSQPPSPLKGELPPTAQNQLGFVNSEGSSSPFRGLGGWAGQPSLILSDIMMPVMDGYQLLKKLKADDRYRHIPVVMLTARADLRDKLQALRIGVDDYLLKPFEEEELLVRIQNLLNNYQNRHSVSNETAKPESTKPTLSQADSDWLAQLETIAQEGFQQKLLSVNWLATQVNLSERQFRRRLQKTSGLTPLQYLTELRLQEARSLLEIGKFSTIAEVAYHIGFNDAAAFSRSFRKYFGKSPSEYLPS